MLLTELDLAIEELESLIFDKKEMNRDEYMDHLVNRLDIVKQRVGSAKDTYERE